MSKIMLADGSEYEVITLGANTERLFFTLKARTAVEDAANLFSDKQKMSSIVYTDEDGSLNTYKGYTLLTGVMIEDYSKRTQVYLWREPTKEAD